MTTDKNGTDELAKEMGEAIRKLCSTQFGELSSSFICKSVGVLNPKRPFTVEEDATLSAVIALLQRNKVGSVVVVDKGGRLCGIFTERDCVLKILGKKFDYDKTLIREVMTPNPVAQPVDTTIAYALNLMSHGGFRHIPIVDPDNVPIGIISVKDMVDYLVQTMTEDLLNLEVDI